MLEEPFRPLSCYYTCRTHCIKTSFRALIILMTPMSSPTMASISLIHPLLIKDTVNTWSSMNRILLPPTHQGINHSSIYHLSFCHHYSKQTSLKCVFFNYITSKCKDAGELHHKPNKCELCRVRKKKYSIV